MRKVLILLFCAFLFSPTLAFSSIGVGVTSGKIQVSQRLKPGIIYKLPPLTIVNTGDEPSDYEAAVTYMETQKELKPKQSWFSFEPKTFHLDPGKAQPVQITLSLPIQTPPGDYFAFLEGHPLKSSDNGTTSIGVAAAAKLYFSVDPANVLSAMYYKSSSLWQLYSPWSERVAVVVGLVLLYFVLTRFLHIEINLKKPKAPPVE